MHVLDGPDLALVSSLTSTLHSFVLVLERAPAHDISASHPTHTWQSRPALSAPNITHILHRALRHYLLCRVWEHFRASSLPSLLCLRLGRQSSYTLRLG